MGLARVVAKLSWEQPRLTVEVHTNEAFVDIVAQGYDAGIRLGEAVQQDMVTVRLVDPFEHVEWADPRARRPEFPGTFAPLLGVLLDEAAGLPPVVDFLHPRKKPAPRDQRRTYIYIGAAAAAIVLLMFGLMQWRLWSLDSQIRTLVATRAKQDKLAKESVKPIKDVESLDAFAAGDITLIDELVRLSEKLPPPEAAQISELSAQTMPKSAGMQIKFTGHVDTSLRKAELEQNLRDAQHSVLGRGTDQDSERPLLQWSIDETVTITPAPEKPPPQPAAAKSPTAKAIGTAKSTTKTAAPKQGGSK